MSSGIMGKMIMAYGQVQLPVYLVRNILNSPQSFIGDVDEIMDGVPVEQEASDNTLHFLFPRGQDCLLQYGNGGEVL